MAHVRKTIRLSIGATQYECEVTTVTLTPTAASVSAATLCEDGTVTDVAQPTWTLDLDYLVDHNAGSLFRFLMANSGSLATFTYEPDPETAPGVTYGGEVRIVAGPAGGPSGAFESGSVSLPVQGQPVTTDPAPVAEDDEPQP